MRCVRGGIKALKTVGALRTHAARTPSGARPCSQQGTSTANDSSGTHLGSNCLPKLHSESMVTSAPSAMKLSKLPSHRLLRPGSSFRNFGVARARGGLLLPKDVLRALHRYPVSPDRVLATCNALLFAVHSNLFDAPTCNAGSQELCAEAAIARPTWQVGAYSKRRSMPRDVPPACNPNLKPLGVIVAARLRGQESGRRRQQIIKKCRTDGYRIHPAWQECDTKGKSILVCGVGKRLWL